MEWDVEILSHNPQNLKPYSFVTTQFQNFSDQVNFREEWFVDISPAEFTEKMQNPVFFGPCLYVWQQFLPK
jgi:hypothetical protein